MSTMLGVYMEYIIYCDESNSNGPKFSDFFGGCIVNSKDWRLVTDALETKKKELNLFGELKWTKVTAQYLERYIDIIDLFFDFIQSGKIKVRIMFRNNADQPSSFAVRRSDDKYFKLYYQFLKHSFGLKNIPAMEEDIFVRIYLDQLPDTHEKCEAFKEYIRGLPASWNAGRTRGKIRIRKDDVADVCSHDHVLLQCTDIVLGAMYFRLNELHLDKPIGSRRRGKRTIAKEKLYKHINRRICEILPNFSIGISTGARKYQNPTWELPYSHWKFVPR